MSPRSNPTFLTIHIDGAARGNPGPAGIGAVLSDGKGRKLREIYAYLGEATNNVAESIALIVALQEALKTSAGRVTVCTDSELLARQVTGSYRVKNSQLKWLHVLIRNLVDGFANFEIRHIPRTENRQADRLANRAVSEGIKRHPVPKRKPEAPVSPATQATFW